MRAARPPAPARPRRGFGGVTDDHTRASLRWHVAGAQFGLTMTEAAFYSYAGLPLPEIVRRMHREQKGTRHHAPRLSIHHRHAHRCPPPEGTDPTDDFIHEFIECKKKAHAAHEEANGPPPPIACVARIAREAVARGIPVAVATSGVQVHAARRSRPGFVNTQD